MATFVSLNRDLIKTVLRFSAAAVILLLLSGGSCPPSDRIYSCGDASSGHCYGKVRFNVSDLGNGRNFGSFSTLVNAVALLGGKGDGTDKGELNNEIWVMQRFEVFNCGDEPRICWVEVGLSAGACFIPSNETHVFWAENRPSEGYACHDLGPLQEQEFGHPTSLLIRTNASDPNTYDVIVMTCVDSSAQCPGRGWIGESINNAMFPDTVDMGMELSGKTEANGPGTNFFGTIVAVPGGAKFLDVNGTVRSDAPPTGAWDSLPTSGNGGSFRTSCCF